MRDVALLVAAAGVVYLVTKQTATVADRGTVTEDAGGSPSLLDQVANMASSVIGGMSYSGAGLALTEQEEGLRLTAYWDRDGYSIGYGHHGPDVYQGMTITRDQAVSYLQQDIAAAEATVNRLVSVQLTQGQFDALVDFVYNEGSGNFEKSTLLKDVNAGNFADVAAQFARWVYSGGNVLGSLVQRRQDETAEFYSGEFSSDTAVNA